MNGVSAFSEFLAEFGSNNAAAAVGWINGDADVHCEVEYLYFVFSALLVAQRTMFALQSTKHQAQSSTSKKWRQATLAIACLYLDLTHLLRGGK